MENKDKNNLIVHVAKHGAIIIEIREKNKSTYSVDIPVFDRNSKTPVGFNTKTNLTYDKLESFIYGLQNDENTVKTTEWVKKYCKTTYKLKNQ